MALWKRKKNSVKGTPGFSSFADAFRNRGSIDKLLATAQNVLLTKGAAAALEQLKDSPLSGDERVIRWMYAVAWNNHDSLPKDFLEEPFLDPIWCQCTACQYTWLISPLLANQPDLNTAGQNFGIACTKCDRVLCTQCETEAQAACPCGGSFGGIRKPNGRTRRAQAGLADERKRDLWYVPPDQPPNSSEALYLYFGFEGRVPIGIDSTLSLTRVASVETHLAWAETLLDCNLYYQAQQQLDAVGSAQDSPPKAKWLRARLRLAQLGNATERSRRRLDLSLRAPVSLNWPEEIKALLESATAEMPSLGKAWLTFAQVNLDKTCGIDYSRAFECAQRAHEILGKVPAVLLALGQALRGVEKPAEAVDVLTEISETSPEHERARQELKIARLEASCQSEPLDIEAHFELGKWCFRQHDRERAERIFRRMLAHCPECPEGYYGVARSAFLDFDRAFEVRYDEGHRLCREALRLNPQFGPAYELLGSIFNNVKHGMGKNVGFEIGDPIEYYRRAIQCDDTCDVALRFIAESGIRNGQLHPAMELLEKAAAVDSDDPQVYYVLAVIYQGVREFLKADWAYRKAKDLWPDVDLDASYKAQILTLCGYEY